MLRVSALLSLLPSILFFASVAHAAPPIGKLLLAPVDPVSSTPAFLQRVGCKGVCAKAGPIDALAKADPSLHLFAGKVQGGWAPFVTRSRTEVAVEAVEIRRSAAGTSVVQVRLTPESGKILAALTAKHVNQRVAIIVGGRVITAPKVMEAITGPSLHIDLGQDGDPVGFLAALHRR